MAQVSGLQLFHGCFDPLSVLDPLASALVVLGHNDGGQRYASGYYNRDPPSVSLFDDALVVLQAAASMEGLVVVCGVFFPSEARLVLVHSVGGWLCMLEGQGKGPGFSEVGLHYANGSLYFPICLWVLR